MYEMNFPLGDGTCRDNVPYVSDNYILGQQLRNFYYEKPYSYDAETDFDAIKEDTSLIKNYDSVYLFTSNIDVNNAEYWSDFLSELEKYGNVDIVNESYNTYLYHFQKY